MTAMPDRSHHGAAHGEARGRVVAGVDDTPGGLAALRYAMDLARQRKVPLVAVRAWALGLPRHGGRRCRDSGRGHVVLAFEGSQARHAAVAITRRAFGVAGSIPAELAVRIETPEGDPALALTEIAGAEDVLVLGAGPRWSVHQAVHGSVGAYCAHHSRCPVIIVTPAGSHGPGAPGVESVTVAGPALPLHR